jgi:hypothetical protein
MISVKGRTVIANSGVTGEHPRREGDGYRSEGCGVGAAGANDPAGAARRATAQDRHAGGDERILYLLRTG